MLVECGVCGKKFKQLTWKHLFHKHNLSFDDYVRRYPNVGRFDEDKMKSRGEKISKKLTGRKLSEEHKRNVSKGLKGIKRSINFKEMVRRTATERWKDLKYKKKVSKAISKGSKGRKANLKTRLILSKAHRGIKQTEETKTKISKSLKRFNRLHPEVRKSVGLGLKGRFNCWLVGVNNPNFNGYSSYKPYSSDFNNELKNMIKTRDDYKCSFCGLAEQEQKIFDSINRGLSIHHINGNKGDSAPLNLMTLCRTCHSRLENYQRREVFGRAI